MSSPPVSTNPQAAAAAAAAAANQALQAAGQSLIAGSTGNSTLDVQTLVQALVAAKTAGPAAMLNSQAQSDTNEITALASLSGALSGLQTALGPFLSGTALSAFTATVTGGTGLTATAGDGAVASSFPIHTTQIATQQSITSGAFTSTQSNALGTGTITLSLGGKSMTINVDSSNDSLSAIRVAINSASNNPGIQANIVPGADGDHLVLTSQTTGASSLINVSVTGVKNDNGLSSLAVTSTAGTDATGASTITSPGAIAWKQTTAAQDAQITINGVEITSPTNTITNAVSGVTLTLTQAAVGSDQTLDVAQDSSTIESDITNFVTSFNSVISQLNTLASPNSTGTAGGGGVLLGDEMLNQIGSALGSIVGTAVSSGGMKTTLASLGITFESDSGGQPFAGLVVDNDTLNAAVENNPAQVAALFNPTNGIAQQLNNVVSSFTADNGIIDVRSNALTADIKSVGDQQDDLQALATQLTSQFQDQFTALNTLMAQMTTNSNFLTALFGGNNSNGALAQNSQ